MKTTKNREDPAYEDLVVLVKARDKNQCQREIDDEGTQCLVDYGKFMRVVRRNPMRPDSMRNLEVVCRKHTPEWEPK